jgi:hypothetical protein
MPEQIEVAVARLEEKVDTLLRMQRTQEHDIKANELALRAEVKELARELGALQQSVNRIWGGVAVVAALISAATWFVDKLLGR